ALGRTCSQRTRVDTAAMSGVTFRRAWVFGSVTPPRGGDSMLRSARTIAPLVRALLFTTAGVAAASAASVGLVGCNDENAPETWVKKLDDPIQRPAAIKRLIQFFEDAMTRANKDRNDANVKALLDKIIEPLTKTYVDGNLDDRTRIELIKF